MHKRLMWLARRVFDGFIVPRCCPVCGEVLSPAERAVCTSCLIKLPLSHAHGPEILDIRGAVNAAVEPGLVAAWFLYDPASPYAELIRTAKYRHCPDLARELGRLYGRELLDNPPAGQMAASAIDVLLPMPMHPFKKFRRGYNQSEEIALGMADALGAEVADNLVAVRSHRTQTRLSATQRAENLRGCFEVRHPDELDGLNLAIVDDIITTGSSMTEAAIALSRAVPGMASVSLLALGLTVKKST